MAARCGPPHRGDPPVSWTGYAVLALSLAVAFTVWQHAILLLTDPQPLSVVRHLPGLFQEILLAIPFAVAAAWLAARAASLFGLSRDQYALRAAVLSLVSVPLFVPLIAVADILRRTVEPAVAGGHAAHGAVAAPVNLAGAISAAFRDALLAQPVVFVTALLVAILPVILPRSGGRRALRRLVAAGSALVIVTGVLQGTGAAPAAAAIGPVLDAATGPDRCATAPQRAYNVSAINVDITVDRFGDHDPFGFMYVLRDQISAVRAQETALKATAQTGEGARVTPGLDKDPIQPLAMRARLGECVVVNLTNSLTKAPVTGPGFGTVTTRTQPGGVPSVSFDVAGVAYDAAGGAGGNAVGNNPATVMVPPGGSHTYRFFLDPLMGEGARVIHSGGDSVQLTAHGLFGAVLAEPAGSTWLDPDTGVDRTNDATFNSFAAIIRPGTGVSFREFAIMYHEIGDEQFALRRPASEDGGDTNCFDDPDGLGAPLPMLDEGGIDNCGTTTDSYRPAARALNYRSEPFFRRQELLVQQRGADDTTLPASESLMYSSYVNGDPATPMPRSYVGEPTKTRLIHAGFEQLHVHHLHGGGDRWPQNPNAEVSNFAGGLEKTPPNDQPSINLDSQTIGPGETYTLQHECGAGGCQQAVGDFLYHCHIAQHYIAGMWGIWRVFDTRQANLAVIPGRTVPPAAVTSDQLVGRQIEGRTVVPQARVTNAATQVALESLVENQMPPQGERIDETDATVWDSTSVGTPTGGTISGFGGKCADVAGANPANGTPIQLFTCNGSTAQAWTFGNPDQSIRALGKCLDVVGASTANGARVQLFTCNGTNAQKWTASAVSNTTLVNVGSNKCLDATNVSSADGTPLQIFGCGGAANQRWNPPPLNMRYLGEPEDTTVWQNYESANPGERPAILFNPNNGRPTYPMLRPHLGMRPPFSPAGHSGAPYLGNTVTPTRPDGLCPTNAPVRPFNVTAISVPLAETSRETDPNGEIYVLNQDKARVIADANSGAKSPDPLVIRSNVGDCVALTLSSELDPAVQQKVNMHTHFVQFDPQGSDGVITGFNYEQSIYTDARDAHTTRAASAAGAAGVAVSNTTNLRVGIYIAVGAGRSDIEIRKITAIGTNQLTFDRPLTLAHATGEPVSVEFLQYRWYSDVDSGTVFWHDHVNGIKSWAHGLFGAHIIEPAGSTYHDPRTGAAIQSGPMADIFTTNLVGVGVSSAFREYMLFLGNGRRGRPELENADLPGPLSRDPGQECEEGFINLRAAPVGERTPPGSDAADPDTTQQRQEFNGTVCRNATSRVNDPAGDNTVAANVSTVDPYVFSSVKYGDPSTPLLRAYAGDPVVIRTIGLNERAEALRIQGHRFRRERFNADGELVDAATTGISERFDYVLDGGAGGPGGMSGDYLYYSTRNFAFESGAWGIFRVQDHRTADLEVLPGRTAPPTGAGFPTLTAATGNTQVQPGPNPPAASATNVTNTRSPCAVGAPVRPYDVSVFNKALPTAPQSDTNGIIYSLTSDRAAILAGTKKVEPLVIRANQGDCVQITLRNQISSSALYGGSRAGFDMGKLLYNPQTSAGTAVGLNPDTTVAAGASTTYTFSADKQLGTSIFQNLGSVASLRHGAYGLVVVEPTGSIWSDSADGTPLTAIKTSSQAIIRPPGAAAFREFALTMGTTDQQYARSIVPYQDVVAGAGVNSVFDGDPPVATEGFNNLSYSSAPLTTRLGLTSNPPNPSANFGSAFSSTRFGDPATPLLRSYATDPVVIRVGVGASDQFSTFAIAGHVFPQEPNMWNGGSDQRSQLLTARSIASGETLDVELVGGAGTPTGYTGDYLYGDNRQPFAEAGMWGIFRVLPRDTAVPGVARL